MPRIASTSLASRAALVVGLAALPFDGACASMCAYSARGAERERLASTHVYDRPLPELWPAVVAALPYDGLVPRRGAAHVVETRWAAANGAQHRVVVEGLAYDARRSGVRVWFEHHGAGDGGPRTTRDRDERTEWQLVEKLDRDAAARIERDARARGERARSDCARTCAWCGPAGEAFAF